MGASSDEQFCLRWNDFQQCIKSTFTDLRDEGEFMDVTLSCDGGEQVKAHKVILSACSVTFRALLKKNPAQHPVIVLWDVQPRDLAAILDFMYHGEVNVKQDHLNSFLAVAERLKVRGLCQNDGSRPTSGGVKPAPPPAMERPKPRPLEHTAPQHSSAEPQAKRPRPSLPVAAQEEDEIEELPPPPPQVKLEAEGAVAEAGPLRRGSAQHYPAEQQHYPMAQEGYDESMQGSEYGDYSGYEDEMGYMDGQGVDPTQGGKGTSCSHCGKSFSRADALRRHIRDIHENAGLTFNCEVCHKPAKSLNALQSHMTIYHRANVDKSTAEQRLVISQPFHSSQDF